MNWMVSESQLDAEQRYFRDVFFHENKKNIWIQGCAGSGKTILLVYSIYDVLVKQPNAKVCVVVFTHSIAELIEVGFTELNLRWRTVPVMTYHQFDPSTRYDYIFVDEVQDIPCTTIQTLKSSCSRLVVAGDENQAIYEHGVTSQELQSLLDCEPYSLQTSHRLSRSLFSCASLLKPKLPPAYFRYDRTKPDVRVQLTRAGSPEEEAEYVWQQSLQIIEFRKKETVAILIPNHAKIMAFIKRVLELNGCSAWETQRVYQAGRNHFDYDSLNSHLDENELALQYVGNDFGCLLFSDRKKVTVMTYHSAKGLDFDHVFLPRLNAKTNFTGKDPETLMFVALTRSRRNLHVTYTGNLHPYIQIIEPHVQKIEI